MTKTFGPLILLTLLTPSVLVADVLFSISDMTYNGAVRIPIETYGDSRMGYAEGTFEISDDQSSAFMVGHAQHQAIAEFTLPLFSTASSISDLPMVKNKQPFKTFFNRIPSGNLDGLDRITGLKLINGKLIANGIEFYDGEANNSDTTFLIEDPKQLANSTITGFFKLDGGSHASGWITPIPTKFHDVFRGDYIFGYASNYPINARSSIGPSAFGVDISDLTSSASEIKIPTYPLIDYSIDNPLSNDPYNKLGENNLWTEVSTSYIGVIVPGSDTYAVFGTSGGHKSGIGYKITQDTGYQCGGPCPFESSDVYNYYWLYNVNDMIDVAQGNILAHQVKPYEFGKINFPFENQGTIPRVIIGANYNQKNNTIFFMLSNADNLQSPYESAPLLLAYTIDMGSRPNSPSIIRIE